MKRNNIYALVTLVVVVILIVSFISFTPQSPPDEEKSIVGKLQFPRDEGSHNEIQETWSLHIHGKGDDGKEYDITGIWTKLWLNEKESKGFEIFINRDGMNIYYDAYTDFRQDLESNATLDIEWITDYGGVMHFKREDPSPSMVNAGYVFQFINDGSYVKADVQTESVQNVTLMGLDGYADMGMLGLIKGYIQAEMDMNGTLLLNNRNVAITGSAMYTHLWGYLPTDQVSFSSVILHGDSGTVFSFSTYIDRVQPAWEFFYVIHQDRYTVFRTQYNTGEGEKTVGMSVDSEYHVKDLAGEKYESRIIDYFPEPQDPSSHRCYPDHRFYSSSYDNFSCVCAPSDVNAQMKRVWEGVMVGSDMNNDSMWGFSQVYTYYMSSMKAKNISFSRSGSELNVTAEVSSSLPINQVILNYSWNISGVVERHTVEMKKSGDVWYADIEIPPEATGIIARVHVQDKSYLWYASEESTYEL